MNSTFDTNTGKPHMRNSGLELLRMVAMLLIVAHHYSVHGGFSFDNSVSFNRIWVQMLSIGGKLGVNIFVVISSYFLCRQTTYKWSKLLKFALEVTIYSILLYVVVILAGMEPFSLHALKKALFPIIYPEWWFASTYFVFLLLCPLLSRILEKTSRKLHLKLLLFFTCIWCIIPTVTTNAFESNSLIWFLYLFFVTSYIRKYPHPYTQRMRYAAMTAVGSYAFIVVSICVFDLLGTKIDFFMSHATHFIGMQTLPLVVLSFSLFFLFLNLPTFYSKPINIAAASVFGVYLIHDSNHLRYFIWRSLLKNPEQANSPSLIVHSVASIAGTFVVCMLLSYLFNFVFDGILKKAASYFAKKMTGVNAYIDSVLAKINDI